MKVGDVVQFVPPFELLDRMLSYGRRYKGVPPMALGLVIGANSTTLAICVFPPYVGEVWLSKENLKVVKEFKDEAPMSEVQKEAR